MECFKDKHAPLNTLEGDALVEVRITEELFFTLQLSLCETLFGCKYSVAVVEDCRLKLRGVLSENIAETKALHLLSLSACICPK